MDDLEEYVYLWASQNWPTPEGRDNAKVELIRKMIEKQVWEKAKEYYLNLSCGRLD